MTNHICLLSFPMFHSIDNIYSKAIEKNQVNLQKFFVNLLDFYKIKC